MHFYKNVLSGLSVTHNQLWLKKTVTPRFVFICLNLRSNFLFIRTLETSKERVNIVDCICPHRQGKFHDNLLHIGVHPWQLPERTNPITLQDIAILQYIHWVVGMTSSSAPTDSNGFKSVVLHTTLMRVRRWKNENKTVQVDLYNRKVLHRLPAYLYWRNQPYLNKWGVTARANKDLNRGQYHFVCDIMCRPAKSQSTPAVKTHAQKTW